MTTALSKIQNILLGGRRLPAPGVRKEPAMTIAEARDIAERFAGLLEAAQREREGMDAAEKRLKDVSGLNLEAEYLSGRELPDLPGMSAEFEGSKLRSRVAFAAADRAATEATAALQVLARHRQRILEERMGSFRAEVKIRLESVGIHHPPARFFGESRRANR